MPPRASSLKHATHRCSVANKWVLETCFVVTNKSATNGAKIDMGGVEFESDEGEEGAVEYEV